MDRLSAARRNQGLARRALLVLLLWAGFWLIAAALVGALGYVPYAQLRYLGSLRFSGVLAMVAAVSIVVALVPRGFRRAQEAKAEPLPRADHAPLYAWIEDIGRRAGVQAPIEVFLGIDANASIGAVRAWHGGLRKLRVCLGLGLFNLLSADELGAVVAHEYGHFVGGDLRLGPWVYRLRNSIGQALGSLDSSIMFLDVPFRWYGQWFLRRTALISRAQEYSADALAARLFGAPATASALSRVHAEGARWSAYLHGDLLPAINRGARLPIRGGFLAFASDELAREDVRTAIREERERAPSPYDSHPLLDERLRALDAHAAMVADGAAQCLELLGGEARAETGWYARAEREPMPPMAWEEFGGKVLLPALTSRFADTVLCPRKVPLSRLPALLADVDGLWAQTRPAGMSFLSPQARRRYVHDILEEFAILGLCERGYVPQVRPGRHLALVGPGPEIRPDLLLQAAAKGELSPEQLGLLSG